VVVEVVVARLVVVVIDGRLVVVVDDGRLVVVVDDGRLVVVVVVVVVGLVTGFFLVVIKLFAFLPTKYKYMEPSGQYRDPWGSNGSSFRSKSSDSRKHWLILN